MGWYSPSIKGESYSDFVLIPRKGTLSLLSPPLATPARGLSVIFSASSSVVVPQVNKFLPPTTTAKKEGRRVQKRPAAFLLLWEEEIEEQPRADRPWTTVDQREKKRKGPSGGHTPPLTPSALQAKVLITRKRGRMNQPSFPLSTLPLGVQKVRG